MKIGVVTSSTSYGGVNKVAMEQVKGLSECGFDATLIALIKPIASIAPQVDLVSQIRVEYRSEFNALPGKSIKEGVRRSLCFLGDLGGRYDLLLAHNLPGCRLAHKEWRKNGTPYVAYIHDPGTYTFFDPFGRMVSQVPGRLARWEAHWMEGARAIAVNSERSRSLLIAQGNYGDVQVIYPSTSMVGTNARPTEQEDFILTVHRLGYDSVFDTLGEVVNSMPDARFVIAGSEVRKRTENICRRFQGFGDRVDFVLNPTEGEVLELFCSARCYFHPEVENFNLGALEAASLGCPVITTVESGVFELFRGKYEEGFLPYNSSSSDWARMLGKILSDNELRSRMGRGQRGLASTWDIRKHIGRIKRFVESAI